MIRSGDSWSVVAIDFQPAIAFQPMTPALARAANAVKAQQTLQTITGRNTMKTLSCFFLVISFSLLAACGGGSASGPNDNSGSSDQSTDPNTGGQDTGNNQAQIARGKLIYENSLSYANDFACSSCHALTEPASDGFIRAGHPIGDATRRDTFKNGRVASFLDSAKSCLSEWMNANQNSLWDENSADYQDLLAYLKDQDKGDGAALPISYTIQAPQTGAFANGDATRGKATFEASCALCHGSTNQGTNIGPAIGSTNPDLIAAKARLSGKTDSAVYDQLLGGSMPFWSLERMSDSDLADTIAHIQKLISDASNNNNTDNGTNEGGGNTSNCGSDHPKVGSIAQLVPPPGNADQLYMVSGQARIVDNCTIRLENFNYTGRGIRVRVFGGKNGNYASNVVDMVLPNGIDNLVRSRPYVNETFDVSLPTGASLDDFDGVSIWCTGIGESFGDGLFEALNF